MEGGAAKRRLQEPDVSRIDLVMHVSMSGGGWAALLRPSSSSGFFGTAFQATTGLTLDFNLFSSSSFFLFAYEKGPKRTGPLGAGPVLPRTSSVAFVFRIFLNCVPNTDTARCFSAGLISVAISPSPPLFASREELLYLMLLYILRPENFPPPKEKGHLLNRRFFGTTGDACGWHSNLMVGGANHASNRSPHSTTARL